MTAAPASGLRSGRPEIEARLRRLGGRDDGAIDLGEAALWLAALDRPRVGLGRYAEHVARLGREVGEAAARHGADSLDGRAAALRAVLVDDCGYRGDSLTYDDPQNANLMRVIDRRKGLPVALGILYLAAARAQGWAAEGLNFPGHFLLALEAGGARAILDPFNGGRLLDAAELRSLIKGFAGPEAELDPAHYTPSGNRRILLRLQNNIKLRLLQGARHDAALAVIETMLLFAPGDAALWREAGLLHSHLGNLRAADLAFGHFLDLGTDPQDRHEAARLLQEVRARLN